jgi:hypothetical protein
MMASAGIALVQINPLPNRRQSASPQYVYFGECHHTKRVCPAMSDQSPAYTIIAQKLLLTAWAIEHIFRQALFQRRKDLRLCCVDLSVMKAAPKRQKGGKDRQCGDHTHY